MAVKSRLHQMKSVVREFAPIEADGGKGDATYLGGRVVAQDDEANVLGDAQTDGSDDPQGVGKELVLKHEKAVGTVRIGESPAENLGGGRCVAGSAREREVGGGGMDAVIEQRLEESREPVVVDVEHVEHTRDGGPSGSLGDEVGGRVIPDAEVVEVNEVGVELADAVVEEDERHLGGRGVEYSDVGEALEAPDERT